MKIRDVRCAGLRGATPEGGLKTRSRRHDADSVHLRLNFTPARKERRDRPAVRPGG